MVDPPWLRIGAWISHGQWMWHLVGNGRVLRWSRLGNFAEECLFFTYCGIGERE